MSTHDIAATPARYVRLNVTQPEQDAGGAARIYEFEVFDTDGPQPPGNLALNRPATGSAACAAAEGPEKAVNGSVSGGNTDKWCSPAGTKFLQVDLQANRTVGGVIIRHAGAGGESDGMQHQCVQRPGLHRRHELHAPWRRSAATPASITTAHVDPALGAVRPAERHHPGRRRQRRGSTSSRCTPIRRSIGGDPGTCHHATRRRQWSDYVSDHAAQP